MLSLNKYIFNIFLFLSIVSQIFLINLSFLGGNIKPSQIFFLLLIFLNIKKLIQFKFPEELVRYGFISLLLIAHEQWLKCRINITKKIIFFMIFIDPLYNTPSLPTYHSPSSHHGTRWLGIGHICLVCPLLSR